MDKYGEIIAPGAIRFERRLPGPIERVWAWLTESEKRGKWLASGEMELFEGGMVNLHFLHMELSPVPDAPPEKYKAMKSGHSFTGRVLKVNPPYLLLFSWEDQSEVMFELTAEGDKVLLVLTHRKLSIDKNTQISVASGWHTHLAILIARLEGATPPGFWTMHSRLEEIYSGIIK
jgi:uncharacterized protein YndB with AHSA1/START domain